MTPAITHILFDLDGTLIDSGLDLANAYNQLLHAHGLPAQCIQTLKKYCAYGFNELLEKDFGAKPKSTANKTLRAKLTDCYESTLTHNTVLFPGVEAMLASLTERKIPWGIVTNKHSRFAKPLIAHFQALRHADVLVCGDTLPQAKPHPRPLLYACEQLRAIPSRTAMVGDTQHDISAAKKAGAKAVLVTYNVPISSETADTWGADIQFTQPADLDTWLQAQT